jgi:aspartyl-tRNA(Asn)/glutamyl-tRNA(Gln) amidotransferase subunit A
MDAADLTIAEAAPLVQSHRLSPVELVGSVLERIDAVEGRVNAFITVDAEGAMASARAMEDELTRGEYRGPLHGIPIGLKDNICTKRLRTTAGSRVLEGFDPGEDATVVARLRAAGAIIVGKNNMHEFALGATTENPHYGASRNPWDLSRIVGGSSGGSGAAVAAGECLASLGTDTGGSVRIPAALNGVTGIRPSIGRVSNHGVVPLAWSSDTVGPLCRSVEDCAAVLGAISGPDPTDPTSLATPAPDFVSVLQGEVGRQRAGIIAYFAHFPLQRAVAGAHRAALGQLERLGMTVREVPVEHLDHNDAAQALIELSETAAYHQEWLLEHEDRYGADVRRYLEVGQQMLAVRYIQALRYRSLLRAELMKAFQQVDVLVTPTVPIVAPPLGTETVSYEDGTQEDLVSALLRFANVASLAGMPALSVPCGFSEDGLPIGLQIMGRPLQEDQILRVAHAYQSSTTWHRRSSTVLVGEKKIGRQEF